MLVVPLLVPEELVPLTLPLEELLPPLLLEELLLGDLLGVGVAVGAGELPLPECDEAGGAEPEPLPVANAGTAAINMATIASMATNSIKAFLFISTSPRP